MARHELTVWIDYHQFYVWDGGADPQAPEDYTEDDVARMVKTGPNVIAIQTVRNGVVRAAVATHEADPGYGEEDWDHVVECALDLPTGHLQVHECFGGSALDTNVPPGTYAARVLFGNLGSTSADGLEGDDTYRVDLWPGQAQGVRVLKAWAG